MHLRLLFFVKRIEVFMRKMRLELTRGNPHKNLNLARLPIPTLPQNVYDDQYRATTRLYK